MAIGILYSITQPDHVINVRFMGLWRCGIPQKNQRVDIILGNLRAKLLASRPAGRPDIYEYLN